jgi:hypothetical protein
LLRRLAHRDHAVRATTPRDGILTVPEGWRQQRGAYGGLTIAAEIRAIEAHDDVAAWTRSPLTGIVLSSVMFDAAHLAIELSRGRPAFELIAYGWGAVCGAICSIERARCGRGSCGTRRSRSSACCQHDCFRSS